MLIAHFTVLAIIWVITPTQTIVLAASTMLITSVAYRTLRKSWLSGAVTVRLSAALTPFAFQALIAVCAFELMRTALAPLANLAFATFRACYAYNAFATVTVATKNTFTTVNVIAIDMVTALASLT